MAFISLLARPGQSGVPRLGLHWGQWHHPALRCVPRGQPGGQHTAVVSPCNMSNPAPKSTLATKRCTYGSGTCCEHSYWGGAPARLVHSHGTQPHASSTGGAGTNPHSADLSNSTTSSQLLKSITHNTNKSKWPGKPTWLCLDTSHNSFI